MNYDRVNIKKKERISVLYSAPISPKGRYQGGIANIAQIIYEHKEVFSDNGIDLSFFNTEIMSRHSSNSGKLSKENFLNFFLLKKSLKKQLKDKKYDVINYHTSRKLALLKDIVLLRDIKKRNKGLKTVLTIHFAGLEEILPQNTFLRRFIIKELNKMDKIIFLSSDTKEQFEKSGLLLGKSEVLYNFTTVQYNFEDIERKISEIKNKDNVDLLFMGSFDRRKGIRDLLEAFEKTQGKCKLHICGNYTDEEEKNRIKVYLERLPERVVFHGFISGQEKYQLISNCDVTVLPSYAEGMPVVIIDGMAAGHAILSTPVGSIPEIIKWENGILFEAGDIDAITAAIDKLVIDRDLLSDMMQKNYEYSKSFTLNTYIDNLCKIYMK